MLDFVNIAKDFGCTVVFVKSGDEHCQANGEDAYINRSCIVGEDEIYIGIYEDEQKMIASFFHEIGHIFNAEKYFNSEADAWKFGCLIANRYGYLYTKDTMDWCDEQLKTYDK